MRHEIISISDLNKDLVAFSSYSAGESNSEDIRKMKIILSKALKTELTHRQRQCVTMYYFDNMKMKEIASILCLAPSTVTRHIKVAKQKLQNIAQYY